MSTEGIQSTDTGGPLGPSGAKPPGSTPPALPGLAPWELDDLEFDLAELEPPDWDAMAARIRWHLSTDYAVALKSIFGEALVSGLGLAIAHNGSGWIGDRLMHPRFRGPELERVLLTALIKELEAKGCSTISVLAPAKAGAPQHEDGTTTLLEELGFTPEGHYVTYGGGQTEVPTLDEVELFEPHHSLGVLRLDKLATGEDRRALISEHFYASRIFVKNNKVLGNYMVLLGEGLILAENPFAGEELLRWHLPHVSEITLPEANTAAIEFLKDRKYTEQRRVLRMVRGPKLNWRPEMVWGRVGNNLG